MKNLLYIGNKLSGRGLNVTTLDTLSQQLNGLGYHVVTASSEQNLVFRLTDMLLAVLRNRQASFILIDTYSTAAFWYAFFVSQLCRLLNKKYIPILHGGNLPNRLLKNPKLCSMLFDNAYKNIAPSHYLLNAFTKAGYTNVEYIPNTIEIQKYPYKQREVIKPKLLWVRAFASIYNPKMAVEVLKELQKKYPGAELCMVGPEKDGSLEETKKYAASLGVTVRFTGKLSKEEWTALARDYDVFINTTHFDNTPVSVMEAMALGLPVVTTNVGGIPFLLEHGKEALLVNDSDVDAMVLAIERLINNPVLSVQLSSQSRIKAETWDWDQVKEIWRSLLFKEN